MKEPKRLADFFARYKERLVAPQRSVEERAALVICEYVGVPVSVEQLSYTPSTRTLVVRAPSVIKMEVQQRSVEIIAALTATLGVKSAPHHII
jgi:hypothetical protein